MKKLMSGIAACLLWQCVFAGDVDTISIYSNSMKKNISCVVITPDSYKKSRHLFPVVYLLHGYSGSYNQWIKIAPQLKNKVDELQIMIVCPDGGYSSWYFDSPVDSSFRYETFVSREVKDYVDKNYHSIADSKHRAISGLSMGGHGGLYLGIRHRDVYGAAGSIGGILDIRPFPNNWDLKKRLGDSICCKQNWENNTVINLINNLKNGELSISFDCGLQDVFIPGNRILHEKLVEMKIDHDYVERPGAHNYPYAKNSIDYQLLFFKKFFERESSANL
ncbi:MAG: alpha/beta hydrolase family protein [Chitinophagaceae bacterium]